MFSALVRSGEPGHPGISAVGLLYEVKSREKHELGQVEAPIRALKDSHAALASSDELDQLWNIIHRPGWTAVAEHAFLINGLESVKSQTLQLTALKQGLVKSASLVGTGRAAGV